MSAQRRKPISASTKRTVRKRCGFGCVICGLPLYEYDHVRPVSRGGGNQPSNITLLCPTHHAEKSKGLLSEAVVAKANKAPKNTSTGWSPPLRLLRGVSGLTVRCGTNSFHSPGGSFVPIVVDGLALLAVHIAGGSAQLDLRLFDRMNREVLRVTQSEVTYATDSWDISLIGPVLKLRCTPSDVALETRFDPAGIVTIERANLYCNGVHIRVDGSSEQVGGQTLTLAGNTFRTPVGLVVGPRATGAPLAAIQVDNVPRLVET